jgi:hypothetical protein
VSPVIGSTTIATGMELRASHRGGHGENPDDSRLEERGWAIAWPRFVCSACGRRGAEIRPDFNWNKPTVTGYLNTA